MHRFHFCEIVDKHLSVIAERRLCGLIGRSPRVLGSSLGRIMCFPHSMTLTLILVAHTENWVRARAANSEGSEQIRDESF